MDGGFPPFPMPGPFPDDVGYFGGYGGTPVLPIWGGAGPGEAHSSGINREGRGLFPFPTN